MQHPDEGTVHAWLDDALSAEDAQALEAHVASCAECGAMVAEARGLIASASRIVRQLDGVAAKVVPIAAAKRAPATRSWIRYSGLAAATLFVATTATWVAIRDKGAIGVTVPSVAMEVEATKAAPKAADSMVALKSTPARASVGRATQSLADRRSEAVAAPMAAAPAAMAPATTASAMPAAAIAARMSVETANDAPVSLAGCYRLTSVVATSNPVTATLRLTDSLTPSDAAKRTTATPIDRLTGAFLGYATGLGPATMLAESDRAGTGTSVDATRPRSALGATTAATTGATQRLSTRGSAASATAPAAAPAPLAAPVLNSNAMLRWSPAGDGLVRLLLADQSTLLIRLTSDAAARAADISRDRDATRQSARETVRAASAPVVQFTATRVSCPP